MPNRRRRRLSTATSAFAALAVASPFAYIAVCDLTAKPAPEHHEFVRAASMTDLPGELMGALTQGLSQFGVSLPPIPSLTGATSPSSCGTARPGLARSGQPRADLAGSDPPGLTSPGLTITGPDDTGSGHSGSDPRRNPRAHDPGSDPGRDPGPDAWRDSGPVHARPDQPRADTWADQPERLCPGDRCRWPVEPERTADQRPGRIGSRCRRHLPDPGRPVARRGAGGTERRAGQRHDERGQPAGCRSGHRPAQGHDPAGAARKRHTVRPRRFLRHLRRRRSPDRTHGFGFPPKRHRRSGIPGLTRAA